MKSYTFTVVIEKEREDEGYYAYCPALPGCLTNGETVEETHQNMHEAMALHLEGAFEHDGSIPEDVEVVVRAVTVQVGTPPTA